MPAGGVLDEVQRVPELLSYVQGIVDRQRSPGQFILTGSHQPEVHQAISQSLAGRTAVLTLLPLSLNELRQYGRSWSPFELPPYFENIGTRVVKSPKLYFVDAGLAAHLIGIRSAEQAVRDPLRGALFENLMVVEVLKIRLNRGLRPDLYFFRDAGGKEVDLIVRDGHTLVPIEIKSAATFAPEFHKGIARFRNALGGRVGPGAVLYTGDQRLQFKETEVLNPLVHDGLDRLACPSLRSARE